MWVASCGLASALLQPGGVHETQIYFSGYGTAFRESRGTTAEVKALQATTWVCGISDTTPTLDDLLGDCHDGPSAAQDNPGDVGHAPTLLMQAEIRRKANSWVQQAARQAACMKPTWGMPLRWEPREGGAHEMVSLNTITLDDSVHEDMRTGIVMLDLFGGIGTGLEALLRTGTVIKRYIYVDRQDVARRVMAACLEELHEHYQQQLPLSAFADAFTALPQDATHLHHHTDPGRSY